MDTSKAPAAHL